MSQENWLVKIIRHLTTPTKNSSSNLTVADILGNKTDDASESSNVASIISLLRAIAQRFWVQTKNSANNNNITDVIGNKTDDEGGDSLYSKIYIIGRHAHSQQKVYPSLANGVTLTTGASAWQLGTITEIIPVNTVTNLFDLHFLNCGAFSASDTYEIVFYKGTAGNEIEISRCRVTKTATQSGTAPVQIQTPLIEANQRISAAIASSSGGGDTGVISVFYHEY